MKKALAITLVLVLAVTMLAGCASSPALSGRYALKSMEAEGMTIDVAMLEMLGMGDLEMYLEFTGGNAFKMAIMGESVSGTYTLNGKVLTMTIEGEDVQAILDGKTITLEMDEGKIIFEKK